MRLSCAQRVYDLAWKGWVIFLNRNDVFLVSASHQLVLIMSLPFVHTARRSYRPAIVCQKGGLELVMSPWQWALSFGWIRLIGIQGLACVRQMEPKVCLQPQDCGIVGTNRFGLYPL